MKGKTPSMVTVHVPLKFTVRGGRKTIIGAKPRLAHTPPRTRFDDSVAKAFARAYRWKKELEVGTYGTMAELARAERINESYVQKLLRLNLLAPDIVEAALDGPTQFTVEGLSRPISINWREQRSILIPPQSVVSTELLNSNADEIQISLLHDEPPLQG